VSTRGPSIGGQELELLKLLWEHPPQTVRELHARLAGQGLDYAYTTVQTMLLRLEAKGFVRCDRSGPAHVFAPAVTRDQLLQQRLGQLAEELCAGSASPLLLALVEGARFTPDEIDQFRKLLDQLESQPGTKPRKRK
jgi:predicted transcriptional regulator